MFSPTHFCLHSGHLQGDILTVLKVSRLEWLGHALRLDGERTENNAWFQASAVTYMWSALFWDVTQRKMVIPYISFGTNYRSYLQGSSSLLGLLVPWRLDRYFVPKRQQGIAVLKGKGLPEQAEVAQGVPNRSRPWIFLTFGTTRVVGRHPYVPTAFTPGEIPGTHF
jgi:hypothetical protein